jgi:hypothetical protein
MSEQQAPSYAAELFQKAHGRIVMLQRIESQINNLIQQRRKVQSELNEAQTEINDELSRIMNAADELPSTAIGESYSRRTGGNGTSADHTGAGAAEALA